MAIDGNLRFSNAQNVTANAASSNVINLSAIRNIGAGRTPYLISQVTTQLSDTGDNSNCTVYFRTDAFEAMNSPTNSITVGVFATNAPVGTKIGPIAISPGKADEQYCDLYYSMGGGDLLASGITSYITFDPDIKGAYPDAITISLP